MPGSPIFRKLRNGDMKNLTGYPSIVLENFAAEFDLPLLNTFVVAATLHLGCSYAAVSAILSSGFDHPITPVIICRMMSEARAATDHTWSYLPGKRHELEDPLWPQCHALIDGVPVYCRGSAEYYNAKNGQKSVVFQVTSDLAGRPLSWSKGLPGRRSDAVAIDGWSPFSHFNCEYLIADSIYMASAHCITPFKEGVSGNPPPDVCEKFEIRHRKIRARIEHLFARIARHRWTRGSDFHTDEIPGYFNIQMHLEARYLRLLPLKYPVERVTKPILFTIERRKCECNFTALNEIPMTTRDTHSYRNTLVHFQDATVGDAQVINKRSRKSAKKLPKTYVPLARKERRARNKAVCDRLKQAGLSAKKLREMERKMHYASIKSSATK